MAYIVHNVTKKTIILSDIRAEIRPSMTLDLERFAHRESIERSHDLIQAIKGGKLKLVSHGMIKSFVINNPRNQVTEKITERVIEKQSFSQEQLEEVVRKVVGESKGSTDIQKIINDALGTGLANITEVLKGQAVQIDTVKESQIDPEKLAQMQQQAIGKVFEDMKTGDGREKKVIQGKQLDDLANELLD